MKESAASSSQAETSGSAALKAGDNGSDGFRYYIFSQSGKPLFTFHPGRPAQAGMDAVSESFSTVAEVEEVHLTALLQTFVSVLAHPIQDQPHSPPTETHGPSDSQEADNPMMNLAERSKGQVTVGGSNEAAEKHEVLQSFTTTRQRWSFLLSHSPIHYVCVHPIHLSPTIAIHRLRTLHRALTSHLPLPSLSKLLALPPASQSSSFLHGTERTLNCALHSFKSGHFHALLSTIIPARCPAQARRTLGAILYAAARRHESKHLVYMLLTVIIPEHSTRHPSDPKPQSGSSGMSSEGLPPNTSPSSPIAPPQQIRSQRRLLQILRPSRQSLHPHDIDAIFHALPLPSMETSARTQTQDKTATYASAATTFMPLALPNLSPASFHFLHATPICALSSQITLELVLVTSDPNTFTQLQSLHSHIALRIQKSLPRCQTIFNIPNLTYDCAELSLPGVRHFVYRSTKVAQSTTPNLDQHYSDQENLDRLMSVYYRAYDLLHLSQKPSMHATTEVQKAGDMHYVFNRTSYEVVLACKTPSYELYLAMTPFIPTHAAFKAVEHLIKWIKVHKNDLLITSPAVL